MKNAKIVIKELFFAISLLMLIGSLVYGETIGPWDIRSAPVSATFQTGDPRPVIRWININNVDISISEAFKGMSVIDDGLGNVPSGSLIEMTFEADTALNIPGIDVVIFEARFTPGSYLFYTNYDSFTTFLDVDETDFSYTGIQRGYYYGLDWGPFPATVWGAPIDLSQLGIPIGTSVEAIRLVTTSNGVDPLGVGSLTVPEPATLSLLALGGLALLRKRRG